MIIDKRSKIAIGIIVFLELLFLARAYIIHSFYKNDELYGDGIPDIAKYDKEFLSTVAFSVLIVILLSFISIVIFRKRK